ncbi:hypothetical protein ALQ33_200149 [Pseudomonas syringae pv. philadelphi]|uniref:Uncharacterized protein n=1 Tax=Pseudomonas syringae pv. philadelphi TaxID=251706 RepID=A0A3M3YBJ9_9PSED|nr:hypothetical protein [Pseudomonas syringae group genomosp. 3]RMO79790.1 hypothetical protein ALQ33_200149 [Pseudomonas syringae pv. philadelphi]
MTAFNLALGFIVVLLDDLWVGGELVNAGETLKVDRAVRNDWVGSKLARDASESEIEEYRAEEAAAAEEDAEAAAAAADDSEDGAGKSDSASAKKAAK